MGRLEEAAILAMAILVLTMARLEEAAILAMATLVLTMGRLEEALLGERVEGREPLELHTTKAECSKCSKYARSK